jgi:nucleotidyltransferase substrate binding protein (TIGR01987 family)
MESLRWKHRFENYTKVLTRLQEALVAISKEPDNHLYEMATIQAFEFTIELGWKLLKDYLTFQGVTEVSLPRDMVRQAFQAQILTDGQAWIDMLEARNKTSHTYDDVQAVKIIQKIQQDFYPALIQVQNYLQERL